MRAGSLRHRVRIERRVDVQDPATGEMVPTWVVVAEDVPCGIYPLAVREYVAGGGEQSEITTRCEMRYPADVRAADRIINPYDGDRIYEIRGEPLPDPTNARHVNIPCRSGVNDG